MSARLCPAGCAVRCKPGSSPPCFFEGNDDILSLLEAKSQRDREGVRALVLQLHGPDALARHDAQNRELDLGITGARATWGALSPPQRRALEELAAAGALVRAGKSYMRASGPIEGAPRFGVATIRNLAARDLGAWAGGAFDPEKRLEPTERASFVLKHGKAE